MILPRKLYRKADLSWCEENDPAQAWSYHAKGTMIPDSEAERLGLKAYLDQTGYGDVAGEPDVEEKMVEQATVEDKAVDAETVEDKAVDEPQPGLHIDPSARGRRGR